MNTPITLGWREHLELPELGLNGLKAKIDTGAKTSALHAFRIETEVRDGQDWVRFWIHPLRKHRDTVLQCEAPIVDQRVVSDSGGHKESRIVISTPLEIQGQSWPIEITLTNRDSMIFPMLLGRTAMEGRVLVDPSLSYVLGREKGRAFRRSLLKPIVK